MFVNNPYFVFINSRDRINPDTSTDSNFTYAVNFPEGETYSHVVLLNCLIPKSYYLIQTNTPFDNVFQLKENNTTVTVTVPVGNYSLSTFRTTIGALLTAASPNALTYTLTYPANTLPDTGKWTYTQTNAAIQSSLIFNSHIYEPFGFLSGSTNAFTGTTLVSSAVIKLQSEDRLLLSCSLVNNGHDSILASINSTTSVNYSSINYECPDCQFYSHLISQQQNTVSFTLSDENFETISLNGLNLNMSLLFYKKDDIFEKIKAFMKMAVIKK